MRRYGRSRWKSISIWCGRESSRRFPAGPRAGVQWVFFLLSPVFRALTYWLGYNFGGGYTWLVADGLAIGALMGVLSRGRLAERGPMKSFSLLCLAAAVGLLAVGTPLGIWRGSTFFGGVFRRTAVDLFYAGVLGVTLLLGTSRFKWIVQRPLLQWFGEISYGLYLIHMLAFDLVNQVMGHYIPDLHAQLASRFGLLCLRFILSVGIAVGVAYVSRKYFEEWFLRLKDRWTPLISSSRVRAVTIVAGSGSEQRTA